MLSFTQLFISLFLLFSLVSATSTPAHRSRKSAQLSKKFDTKAGIGAHWISVGKTASPSVPTAAVAAVAQSSSSSSAAPVATSAAAVAPGYGSGY